MNEPHEDLPDTIEIALESHLGRNSAEDAEALEDEFSTSVAPIRVQENFPFGVEVQEFVTYIVVPIASAAAYEFYQNKVEPSLQKCGKILIRRFLKSGSELPPSKQPPKESVTKSSSLEG